MRGLFFATIVFLCSGAWGQGTRADYERAEKFSSFTAGKVLNLDMRERWFNETQFWYRKELGEGRSEYVLVDAMRRKQGELFSHRRLATVLSRELNYKVEPDQLPISRLVVERDGRAVRFALKERSLRWVLDTDRLEPDARPLQSTTAIHPDDAPNFSGAGVNSTTITFENSTDDPVEVIWRDYEGGTKVYHTLQPRQRVIQNTFEGHVWVIRNLRTGDLICAFIATDDPQVGLIEATSPARAKVQRQNPLISPDRKWQLVLAGTEVRLKNLETGNTEALAMPGEVVRQATFPIAWSPDSTKVVFARMVPGMRRRIPIFDSTPVDQLQPKWQFIRYDKPGDALDVPNLSCLTVSTKKVVDIDTTNTPNPWSLDQIIWKPNSSSFFFLFNQRGHQILRLMEADPATGSAKMLYEENSATFIDYSSKLFLQYLPTRDAFLWMSEKSGYNHLYLIDAKSGQVRSVVTSGEYVVKQVREVDEKSGTVLFKASSQNPTEDPYHEHFYRVSFDGTSLTQLTEGDGTHTIRFSPSGTYFIDQYSRVDMAPVTELRDAKSGKLVLEVCRADDSELRKAGWRAPVRFAANGRDGQTRIFGFIVFPTNFDPSKKYPIIEDIYAGPHDQHVRKRYSPNDFVHQMAELGFIAVKIDGMGTNWRSKQFHDYCWKNLADAGFPDRITWIRSAAEQFPMMDTSRVGVYGVSAGGQNALHALLLHGDFYKVAVADCGCYDNRMDKVWWNEQWMGYPIGPHYEAQSGRTLAKNLQGKLLLMLGERDSNVDPASTYQVVDALIKANKDFELLVMPGVGHGCISTPYAKRRLQDFFVRNLLGVEPRS